MPDAIVVGSGPNGLAAAIALARAGRSVSVLEAQPTLGGAVRSAALTLPGFIHDLGSASHPLGAGSPFFRTLPLAQHGLKWISPPVALAHPLDDGTAPALSPSFEQTCATLGKDGPAWRALLEPLAHRWDALGDELLRPMIHLPRHPLLLASFGMAALQSATGFARRAFRDEPARALFAGLAAHSFLPLESMATASFALVLAAAGHAVDWPLASGGSQAISDALASHLRSLGGTIETNRRVDDVRDLGGGSKATLLDLTAWQAARVAGSVFPQRYRETLARFPHAPSVFKIDYALRDPIPWMAEPCRRAGTLHLGGTLSKIAAAEREVADGKLPERPFVLVAQPSLFDRTRAPASQHTAWAYAHIPRGCAIDCTARIEAQIERFAPGFRDCILARHITTPGVLAAENSNLDGGDISGGANYLSTLIARPTLSFNPYRTPVRGLYLCSSSTPPGGGVHGMCGYHAALAVLARELR